MEAAAAQQQGGYRTKRSSVVRRKELRHRLQHELMPHLVTVAEDARLEQPSLAEHFKLPKGNEPNKVFLTVARTTLEQGQANRDVLITHGMADKLLDDLGWRSSSSRPRSTRPATAGGPMWVRGPSWMR